MRRTFELFEIEASMLPIFHTNEWIEYENLTDAPNGEVVAYGFDSGTQKYVALYKL